MLAPKDTLYNHIEQALTRKPIDMRTFWRICDELKPQAFHDVFVNQRDANGRALLHKIVEISASDTTLLTYVLSKLKLSLQPQGIRGLFSALFSPSQKSAEEQAMDLGRFLNITDQQGNTPLDLASFDDVAVLLVRHGARFSEKKQVTMTPETLEPLLTRLKQSQRGLSPDDLGYIHIQAFCENYRSILSRPSAATVGGSAPGASATASTTQATSSSSPTPTTASRSSSTGPSVTASTAVSSSTSAPAGTDIDTPVSIDDFFKAIYFGKFDEIKDMLTRDRTLVKKTKKGKSALQKPFDIIVKAFSDKKFFAANKSALETIEKTLDKQVSVINHLLSIEESFIDTLEMDANNKLEALVFLQKTNQEKLAILIQQVKILAVDSAQSINDKESLDKQVMVMNRLLTLIRSTINQLKQNHPHLEWFDVVKQGNVEKVRALISSNPKLLGLVDAEGNTALHYAARLKNITLVSMLAKQETVHITNTAGLTALDITLEKISESESLEISIALMLAGASIADGNFLSTCDIDTLTIVTAQLTKSIEQNRRYMESLQLALIPIRQRIEEITAKIESLEKALTDEDSERAHLQLTKQIREQQQIIAIENLSYKPKEEAMKYAQERIAKVEEAILVLVGMQEALSVGSSTAATSTGLPPVSSAPAEASLEQHSGVTLFQPAPSAGQTQTVVPHIKFER